MSKIAVQHARGTTDCNHGNSYSWKKQWIKNMNIDWPTTCPLNKCTLNIEGRSCAGAHVIYDGKMFICPSYPKHNSEKRMEIHHHTMLIKKKYLMEIEGCDCIYKNKKNLRESMIYMS
jgi:hypothetical protein